MELKHTLEPRTGILRLGKFMRNVTEVTVTKVLFNDEEVRSGQVELFLGGRRGRDDYCHRIAEGTVVLEGALTEAEISETVERGKYFDAFGRYDQEIISPLLNDVPIARVKYAKRYLGVNPRSDY